MGKKTKKTKTTVETAQVDKKSKRKKLTEKAKKIKKFPRFHKGYSYKAYMKGFNIYVEVSKLSGKPMKSVYMLQGEQLVPVSSTMPNHMHNEYQRVLANNVGPIIYNLKWYQLLLYRITHLFSKKKNK